jgi:hypothetical protein
VVDRARSGQRQLDRLHIGGVDRAWRTGLHCGHSQTSVRPSVTR